MHRDEVRKALDELAELSILYLRCAPAPAALSAATWFWLSFNSLFEMRKCTMTALFLQ